MAALPRLTARAAAGAALRLAVGAARAGGAAGAASTSRSVHASARASSSRKGENSSSSSSSGSSAPEPISLLHKVLLGTGAAVASLHNPARGDMIALLSELSGEPVLPALRDAMLGSPEGRRLLLQRPQINTQSVDMAYLRSLPEGSFGKEYTRWLDWNNVGPDTRAEVLHVNDEILRYVMTRNRQSHDMHHVLCLMPVSHLGETVVKIFEAAHFGLPVSYLSSIAGPLRLSSAERQQLFSGPGGGLAGWAWREGRRVKPLIGVYWEERWEQNFDEMRAELGFEEPLPSRVDYAGRAGSGKMRGRWPSKVLEEERRAKAQQHTPAAQ